MRQKLVINQAIDAMGLANTQVLATVFDGITRHSAEGMNLKHRAGKSGGKEAVHERGLGALDWTRKQPINPKQQRELQSCQSAN